MLSIGGKVAVNADVRSIVDRVKLSLRNGKLRDVRESATEVTVSCPFHAGGHEEHGSCYIRKEDGVFFCFGCNEKGNLLKFVAACFDSSEEFAKDWLLKTFDGEELEPGITLAPAIQFGKPKAPKQSFMDPKVLDGYQPWHPYLATRKLSRATCEAFNVKYDSQRRQVVFPCYDAQGRLLMLPRRSIDTKSFYIDAGKEKPVYCLDRIEREGLRSALIVEGPIDCLTGWEYGFPTIATLGRISDEQIERLKRSCLAVIYMAFDNDEAGRRFADVLRAKLGRRMMLVDVKLPSDKKDINDCSKEEVVQAVKAAKEKAFGENA